MTNEGLPSQWQGLKDLFRDLLRSYLAPAGLYARALPASYILVSYWCRSED
jgi:hypothetical protein